MVRTDEDVFVQEAATIILRKILIEKGAPLEHVYIPVSHRADIVRAIESGLREALQESE